MATRNLSRGSNSSRRLVNSQRRGSRAGQRQSGYERLGTGSVSEGDEQEDDDNEGVAADDDEDDEDDEEYDEDDDDEHPIFSLKTCWVLATGCLPCPSSDDDDITTHFADRRDAPLEPACDVYDAVAVASFNGVQMSLGKSQSGSELMQVIHPIFLWFCAFILFLCQMRFILAVIIEVNQKAFMSEHDKETAHIWEFTPQTKLALITVVQIMVNAELSQSAQSFAFFLNPGTWRTIIGPSDLTRMLEELNQRDGMSENSPRHGPIQRAVNSKVILAPLIVSAATAKLIIAYYTSVSSISIIYTSDTLTEAIFNSLALTFIKDLDEAVWGLLVTNFRMKYVDSRATMDTEDDVEGSFKFSMRPLTPEQSKFPSRIVHKGMFRRLLVCALLWHLYENQMFMSVDVLRTGWLPSSRQVCWLWRHSVREEENNHWLLRRFVEACIWGAGDRLKALADPDLGGYCDGSESEYFLSFSQKAEILQGYPASIWSGIIVILAMVVIPPFTQIILEEWNERKDKDAGDRQKRKSSLRFHPHRRSTSQRFGTIDIPD
mmetsp:Transcript_15210/g.32795  ORF Transcript_15210/g.32795 Transcript_15210/m.32795 type:complete len:547 (+) Transcript_15210:63-1703(+)